MPDLTPEQRRTAQEANRAAVALIRAAAEGDKAGVLTLIGHFANSVDDMLPILSAVVFTAGDVVAYVDLPLRAHMWPRLERKISQYRSPATSTTLGRPSPPPSSPALPMPPIHPSSSPT